MHFRPLHDRVVVRRIDAEEKTAGARSEEDEMIKDQTIGSARAERNWNDIGQRVTGNLLTALLAVVLVLASLTNLTAVEGLSQVAAERANHTLSLPPIRYLESTPWMNWDVVSAENADRYADATSCPALG